MLVDWFTVAAQALNFLVLAWLLKRSPVMLPIPGTSKVKHLEQNVAAAAITLTDAEFQSLGR